MPPFERALGFVAAGLIAVILAGLARTRRLGSCVAWDFYLVAVLVTDVLICGWPSRFWRGDFWVAKENLHNLLKFAVVVELMVRVFHHFPSAYASVRRAVLLVVLILSYAVWSAAKGGTGYQFVLGRVFPHVTDATAWLFVALGAYCLWYHLPLDSIHKAILIGFVPYLLVYSVVQRAVGAMGSERGALFNLTAPHAYLCLLAYWAVCAWRRGDDDGTRIRRMVPPAG
jgi:hypothetical protein